MQPIDRYLSLVTRMTSVSFCKEERGVYLLKRPSGIPSQGSIPSRISFETMHETVELDPFATEWRIASLKKREGNPYADRISVGRATNCDVVLRVPFISKVQAHILDGPDGSQLLRPYSGAGVTLINGSKVDSNSPHRLAVGDIISFGSMSFEYVDAARLYEVLSREALRRNSDKD